MRTATAVAAVLVVGTFAGLAATGLGGLAGGDLVELWVSDTPRENTINHHAVGVGPEGETVVAPVAAVGGVEGLTETSCTLARLATGDGAVLWRTTLDPSACFTHALTEPAIRDVDGDGDHEVLSATTEAALVAYGAATGREEFRVPLSTYGYGRPTVANLTASSGPEVVVVDIDGNVTVTTGEGTVLWRHEPRVDTSVWAAPTVADLDADGAPEVAVGSADGVVALDATGDTEWRRPVKAVTTAAGQADSDPAVEVVAARNGGVVALDGATGDTEWETPVAGTPSVHGIREGSEPRVYVSTVDRNVVALDAETGQRQWETSVADGKDSMAPPAVADVNGDGTVEVVAGASDGTLAVLDADTGAELAAYSREVPVWTHPTPADIDGDDTAELLVRYGDGRVVALDYR